MQCKKKANCATYSKSASIRQLPRINNFSEPHCAATQTDMKYFIEFPSMQDLFAKNLFLDDEAKNIYFMARDYINKVHQYINKKINEHFFSHQEENIFQIPAIPDYCTFLHMILNKFKQMPQMNNEQNNVREMYNLDYPFNIGNKSMDDTSNIFKSEINCNGTQTMQQFNEKSTSKNHELQKHFTEPIVLLNDDDDTQSNSTYVDTDGTDNATELKTIDNCNKTKNTIDQGLMTFEEGCIFVKKCTDREQKICQSTKDRTSYQEKESENAKVKNSLESHKNGNINYSSENITINFKNFNESRHNYCNKLTKSCFNIVNIQPQINLFEYAQKKLENKSCIESNLKHKLRNCYITTNKPRHSSVVNVPVDKTTWKNRPNTPKKISNMFDRICTQRTSLTQEPELIESDSQTDPDSIILDDEEFRKMSQTRYNDNILWQENVKEIPNKQLDTKQEKSHPLKLSGKDLSKLSQKVINAIGLFTERGDMKPGIIDILEGKKDAQSNDKRNKPFRNKRQWDIQIHLKPKEALSSSVTSLSSGKSVLSLSNIKDSDKNS